MQDGELDVTVLPILACSAERVAAQDRGATSARGTATGTTTVVTTDRTGGGPVNPLGDDLLAWLVLALGGALLVGNVLAIVRPPGRPGRGHAGAGTDRPPPFVAAVGLVASVWALASLIVG